MEGNGNMTIKVTMEAFEAAALDLERKTAVCSAAYEAMRRRVRNMSSYWLGDAGDAYRELFLETEDDMDQILKRFREHPGDLRTMAGIYRQAESEQTEIGQAVPNDLIS